MNWENRRNREHVRVITALLWEEKVDVLIIYDSVVINSRDVIIPRESSVVLLSRRSVNCTEKVLPSRWLTYFFASIVLVTSSSTSSTAEV